MTYRDKIQQLIMQINNIYEEAEWLRDVADLDEKQYWNKIRATFYDAAEPLQKLDNSLSAGRASMELS